MLSLIWGGDGVRGDAYCQHIGHQVSFLIWCLEASNTSKNVFDQAMVYKSIINDDLRIRLPCCEGTSLIAVNLHGSQRKVMNQRTKVRFNFVNEAGIAWLSQGRMEELNAKLLLAIVVHLINANIHWLGPSLEAA